MKTQGGKILGSIFLAGAVVYAVYALQPTETKIVPSDPATQDYFGDAVAMDGDTLAVGASLKDVAYQDAGAVYVYVNNGSGWLQQQKILNTDTEGFLFGTAVGVSGDTLVVGCPFNYQGNLSLGGAAFVYVRSGGQWTLQQRLAGPAAFDGDGFGYAVAIRGDTVVVGAESDIVGGVPTGAAYVFQRQGATWTLAQTLVGSDAVAFGYFGTATAVSSNAIVVGAIGDGSIPGAAYVFARPGASWVETQKLMASDATIDDGFGLSVGVSGDTVVAGAPRNSLRGEQLGAAYVFVRGTSGWTEQQKLEDSVGKEMDQYGHSVALCRDRLVVGSVSANTVIEDTGAVDLYVRNAGVWSLDRRFAPADLQAHDVFGHSVALTSSRLAVGSLEFFHFKSGAAYVFETGEPPDTTPPVVNCPPAQTVSANAQGKASIPDAVALTTATDDRTPVADLVKNQSPVAGTLVGLGTYTITVEAVDQAGNVGSCTTTFTVVDTTPPSVVAPLRFTASADGNCQATVPNVLGQVVVSDNCTSPDAIVKSQSPAAGTPAALGDTVITVTAVDASGNRANTVTTFSVLDTTAPSVTAPVGVTLSAGSDGKAAVPNFLQGLVASDSCTPATGLVKGQVPAVGALVGLGLTQVTVSVSDVAGNTTQVSTSVNVVDTTAPSIQPLDALTVEAGSGGKGVVPNVLPNVVASDNCTPANALVKSQSPTAGTLVDPGVTTIVVTVRDGSGNSSTVSTTLTVTAPVDRTPPSIDSAFASPEVITKINGKMVPVTVSVSVSDNSDPAPKCKIVCITSSEENENHTQVDWEITGDLTAKVRTEVNSRSNPRVYTLMLRCTDASGNSSTASAYVVVCKDQNTAAAEALLKKLKRAKKH